MMFCLKCGHENSKEAKFCAGCGAEMGQPVKSKWIPAIFLTCIIVLAGTGAGYGYATDWSFKIPKKTIASPVTEELADTEDESGIKIKTTPAAAKQSKEQTKDKTVLIKESLPSVFTIVTGSGSGSGFLYKKGGYIVTNAHVVAGFTDVVVRNSKGEDMSGRVVGISDKYDVALIKSDANKNVRAFVTEQKETPIGTEVIAIGSPKGFENTASIGYLTGLNRNVQKDFTYEKIYQIDAQIDHGSSGGPLLDANTGKVIGINSLLYKENTVFGFSIPMYSMQALVDKWINQPMSGKQVASLFGVYEDYVPERYYNYEDDYNYDDYDSYYDDGAEEEYYPEDTEVYDEDVAHFIQEFRSQYEVALANENYAYIEDFVAGGSSAANELSSYLDEMSGQNVYFDFIESTLTDVMYYDTSFEAYTYETFNFTDISGNTDYIEKRKIYTIVVDEYGHYQIMKIVNQ
ncbi:trypsin-like peptidase domain-containing protein [Sporosarcina sp.]|uniref:trypsin-like peptidase domain-containing protein n=1 Tax=Sporosarcina sp. TaxID=49982 RepID=UPI002626475F|nr:trypsin-like peptidase domain-containing protein [Sporosarcina sp.]